MVITPNQLRSLNPRAYQGLLDEGETSVELQGDDRLELLDGTYLYVLYTRGGDPGCALECYLWHPSPGEWVKDQ